VTVSTTVGQIITGSLSAGRGCSQHLVRGRGMSLTGLIVIG